MKRHRTNSWASFGNIKEGGQEGSDMMLCEGLGQGSYKDDLARRFKSLVIENENKGG